MKIKSNYFEQSFSEQQCVCLQHIDTKVTKKVTLNSLALAAGYLAMAAVDAEKHPGGCRQCWWLQRFEGSTDWHPRQYETQNWSWDGRETCWIRHHGDYYQGLIMNSFINKTMVYSLSRMIFKLYFIKYRDKILETLDSKLFKEIQIYSHFWWQYAHTSYIYR